MKNAHKIMIIGVIAILIVLAIGFLYYKTPSAPSSGMEVKVLEIAEKDENVIQFKQENPDATSKVSILEPEQIKEDAKKYPAIYGDLPEKRLYEVNYNAAGIGLMLIIDVEEEAVLKVFSTSLEFV